jgi:hypothetical protein
MKLWRALITMALSAFVWFSSCAQVIENVHATLDNGIVSITYDLTGAPSNQKYAIAVYGSYNKFSLPLVQVTGDVGRNIAGGTNKKIEWDPASELASFKGDINFKVRGEAMPLPIAINSPASGSTVRRGKSTTIHWSGGKKDQPLKLSLLSNGTPVQAIGETKNTGSFVWQLPPDLKTGDYTLTITSGNEVVNSRPFAVKAKVPMLLKIAPIVVVGGAAAALAGGGSPSTSTDNRQLPKAPDPD